MRILVDATALHSVAAGSGIGTYTRNLIGALATTGSVEVAALAIDGTILPPSVQLARVHRRLRRPRGEVVEHAVRLPADLAWHRHRHTVFHSPGFHAPLGAWSPWVQTLHDVIPLVLDHPDVAALKARWKRFGPRYRRADAVVAVSRHAGEEGVRLLGLDPARIHIAPHGVDPQFRPDLRGAANPPYLLVVGEYSRRKGFAEAFQVLDAVARAGFPHRLVVAGRIHPWGKAELEDLRRRAAFPDRIELRGFVPSLAALYARASAFLMTSRYEGFGLPVVEAMASGVPVISFSNTALTEVVTGGGVLVPDGDVQAMVAATSAILGDEQLALEWRDRALQRAQDFTWEASATAHLEAYAAAKRRR